MIKIKKVVRALLPATIYEKMAYYKMLFQMSRFTKKYPSSKVFYYLFKDVKREYYSQLNQDYIVSSNFFKNKKEGVFCDVGGNHPLNINNTRYFEEQDWNGYAFEPLPHMEALWAEHRKAKFFPIAASDTDGQVTFTMVQDESGWEDMLSYVKETSNVNYSYGQQDITVRARPLKDVFKEEGVEHIDYMSIDVEGHELKVIQGIDFNAVCIDVLTVENNFGGIGEDSHYGDDKIRNIMFENGYILWGRIVGLDDIFVRKEFYQSRVESNSIND